MTEVRFAVGGADADLAERLDKEISDFNAAVTGHHDGRMLSVAVRGEQPVECKALDTVWCELDGIIPAHRLRRGSSSRHIPAAAMSCE